MALGVVVLAGLEIPLGILLTSRERNDVRRTAQQDAASLASLVGTSLEEHAGQGLARIADNYRSRTHARLAIVDSHGTPVVPLSADEHRLVSDMHAAVARAFKGHTTIQSGHDSTGPLEVAVQPADTDEGVPVGAVIVGVSASAADHRVRVLIVSLVVIAVAVLGAIVALSFVLARSVVLPLADLEDTAARLGAGDLATRAPTGGPTEVRALANTFNAMADRLDELLTSQQHFVADASHQLRSPLAALRLRLEAIDPTDAAATRRHLDGAIEEVGRLSRLIDGLLTLARSEGARPKRAIVTVDELARERVDMWSPLYDERDVALELEAPTDSLRAWDVPGHLDQVLDNLLANALDAAPAGSTVSLSAAASDNTRRKAVGPPHVVLRVSDRGPGMTEAERRAAFDRYWQGNADSRGASGLGLAISSRLVRASGGTLMLQAREGGGLEAVVTLEAAS